MVEIEGWEKRVVVVWRKWVEVVEVEEKVGSNVCEVELWMNVDGRVGVVGKNVVG